jgi:NTE family protein
MTSRPSPSVGLVLGGGGVTGAAWEMATLMALEMATGWSPERASVVVGTSAGAFVAALVRHSGLHLDSLVEGDEGPDEVARRISERLFTRARGAGLVRWVRHGLLPGVRQPGLGMLLASPARWEAGGLARWVAEKVGPEAASGWPATPTVITAFDVQDRRRVAFGTEGAPRVGLADAVAASSAIPVVFQPYRIDGRYYVDGGVMSGTHADLVLGSPEPLDLVVVLAPMAMEEERPGAWPHERLLDRVGAQALSEELQLIASRWPDTDVVVLRPSPHALSAMRPNPMDSRAAVPTFMRTLVGMRKTLARTEIWEVLAKHLVSDASRIRP